MALNDPYFTPAELKARYSDVTADDGTINQYRVIAEQALEDACGVAFVPRSKTVSNIRPGSGPLLLQSPLRTISTVTVDGTDWTTLQITDLTWDGSGVVSYRWGSGLVTIIYEHGYDAPPGEGKLAAMELTHSYLVGGSDIDPRAESIVTVDGTLRLTTGGRFGLPMVEAFVDANRLPAIA